MRAEPGKRCQAEPSQKLMHRVKVWELQAYKELDPEFLGIVLNSTEVGISAVSEVLILSQDHTFETALAR